MNFSLQCENGPMNPETFYKTFDCYYLNEAQTRLIPEHYLRYQARANENLYTAG